MRTLKRNENKTLKIANRTGEVITDDWGNSIYTYGLIEIISLCLLPMENEVEAQAFGVSLIGGLKSVLQVADGAKFNEFTHIWLDKQPDIDRQNTQYVVKAIRPLLTHTTLVIEKKAGE
ncbi:MAG: hypothetical protein RR248_06020 [Clostridia bacterium]